MRIESLAACLIFSAPALARGRPAVLPDARSILVAALSASATGYQALERVQSFPASGPPKAVSVKLVALPGGRFFREVRRRAGAPVAYVLADDGARRTLYWPKLATAWTGPAAAEPAERAVRRLLSVYELSVSTGGRVAKRPTWRLNFAAPGGSLRRALWADRETGIVLKSEDYRPDGTLSRRERVTALSAVDARETFPEAPPGAARAALTAPAGAGTGAVRAPGWIPDGFLPLRALRRDGAVTFVYGDGTATLTVRQGQGTDAPGRAVSLGDGTSARLSENSDGSSLTFTRDGRSYAVSGEVPADALVRVADSLAGPP